MDGRRRTTLTVLWPSLQVTEMMDAHTAALKTFEKALAATDAAATQQAKAHQAVHKLETQLQDERNSAWAREAALQAALDDTKRSFAELQKVQEESLSRMQQLELEVQSLRGRLSKAKSEGLQQEAALKLRIQGLEVNCYCGSRAALHEVTHKVSPRE